MISGTSATRADKPGFSTTHWSIIATGADPNREDEKAQRAFAQLCRTYWRPLFLYVCRRGFLTEDAQDLTQDFFTMMVEKNWLKNANRERGRFRSFLLKSLQNFLNDAGQKRDARKRGGGLTFVSWDEWIAEAPSQLSVSAQTLQTLPPERLFDVRWAATVVEEALRRLSEECERTGRLRLFDALSAHLTTERSEVSYTSLSRLLGVSESMVKRQLHNMRQRYRWLLRAEVGRTVSSPAEVDDEIRHLCAALAADG